MKNKIQLMVGLAAMLSFLAPVAEARSIYGIIGFDPGGFLISPDIDGFNVSISSRSRYSYYYKSEEIEGVASWAPMLRAGIRFDAQRVVTDLTIGGGSLIGGAFIAPVGALEARLRFRLRHNVMLGPQLGVVYVGEPDWQGDADISFSDTTGVDIGFGVTIGGQRRILFNGSLSYLAVSPLDVETGSGWRASDRELDISGAWLKLGVLFIL